MRRSQIAPGVHLSYDAAQKFNRCRISIHFAFPAQRATATAHALLPLVLERGYADCPDMTLLTKKLAKLYGADLTVDARPMGCNHNLCVSVTGIKDRFALEGEALQANYVTNGVAHARTLAQKGCRVFLPGGLLRPQTEAIVGAAAVSSLQQYNFTKAFIGANGVALEAGFTTPDPEEAAVKATVVHRARESWFLVDDAKFARICPAVIADLHSGAILTNRCPNPKYKQFTLVKETEV